MFHRNGRIRTDLRGGVWSIATLALALSLTACDDDGGDQGGAAGAGGQIGGAGGQAGGAGGQMRPDAALPDAGPRPACGDGLDNDDDGLIDYPADPGCESLIDEDEADLRRPACDDEVDNDADGFTDFPADPGCGSLLDDDEFNEPSGNLPACGNGADDDNDGLVDIADPGCTSVADPREQDPDEAPICANLIDDDADGLTDFPLDPGCGAAGADDETDSPNPPACVDGVDNDDDGLTDYPLDPGCAGLGDRDESDPPLTPACADGRDNDRDGLTDYPDDPGCEAAGDTSELGACGEQWPEVYLQPDQPLTSTTAGGSFSAEGSCGGSGAPEVVYTYVVREPLESLIFSTTGAGGTPVETVLYARRRCLQPGSEVACQREALDGVAANTLTLSPAPVGTYSVFVDSASGVGGGFTLRASEIPLAQCLNERDDDGDGLVDFPEDPGCAQPDDREEQDPDVAPVCADGLDNDGDGLTDWPLDPGCIAAASPDETDQCGAGVRFELLPQGRDHVRGTTAEGTQQFAGSCGGNSGLEKVYVFNNRYNARLSFSVDNDETDANTVLYVRSDCDRGASELACSEGIGEAPKGKVILERAAPGDYFVFVDSRFGDGNTFRLDVQVERLPAGCSDELDNDGDGFIDGDDLGCADANDEDERDPGQGDPLPRCADGQDNDADGLVDFPYDPGCAYKGGDSEADPAIAPACANGLDDDESGLIDYPADPGCFAAGDDVEAEARTQCSNRIDDDQDGIIDFPLDPGCAALGDLSEANDAVTPACADNQDNDRDGLVDYPFDPGCASAGDRDEGEPEPLPACSNGLDDDEDGITDFPRDPGCEAAGDESEVDPAFTPQCSNGRDDDNNGRTDFPDDPGCRFAADATERLDGVAPPRCADGVDNDDDGLVDLADVGCTDSRDNDETDLEEAPYCADGVDNDEDGDIDWPEDPGCAAQGDVCEQEAFGLCDGACTELMSNPDHCGRCGRACGEGVECVEGRCGDLRPIVMLCGRSTRDVNQFIRGGLAEAEIQVQEGCAPTEDTQALLISRNGGNSASANAALIRAYVEDGGQVITEFSVSHTVYNFVMQGNVAQGNRNGSCRDNVQPVVQFSPEDRFWQDNAFVALPSNQSGCGHDVGGFPNVVPLGGWDRESVSLGYVDLGAGRLWLADVDWQDNEGDFTDISLDLMAYMIAGGAL